MDINITENANHTLIMIAGRIDAITAPDLDARFSEYDQEKQEKVPVIIDLSQAEYISSAGLRSVLKMAKVCNSQKIRFLVCGIQPPVYEVFRISGFTSLLTIKNTRQEALDAL